MVLGGVSPFIHCNAGEKIAEPQVHSPRRGAEKKSLLLIVLEPDLRQAVAQGPGGYDIRIVTRVHIRQDSDNQADIGIALEHRLKSCDSAAVVLNGVPKTLG